MTKEFTNPPSETPKQRDARIAAALAAGGVPEEITRPVEPDEVAKAHADAVRRLGSGATRSRTEVFLSEQSAQEEMLRGQLATMRTRTVAYGLKKTELAEVLKRLGRLDEAAQLAPKRRKIYERLAEAIEKGDDVDCTCEDYVFPVAHPTQPDVYPIKQKLMPRYETVDTIYSYKYETIVALTQCLRCGDWNARATLPPLMQERATLAGLYPGAGVGSDYDTLPDA